MNAFPIKLLYQINHASSVRLKPDGQLHRSIERDSHNLIQLLPIFEKLRKHEVP